ncbi:MAG: hypothetical protein HYU53_08935 [Acidobacteria bacterium]|nr:hypothetical protein [Acidobacteriota bacterium]
MVWFLERNDDVMACEVRKAPDGTFVYEVTVSGGQTRVRRFDRPTPFIDGYLQEQQDFRRQGWRPRLLTMR